MIKNSRKNQAFIQDVTMELLEKKKVCINLSDKLHRIFKEEFKSSAWHLKTHLNLCQNCVFISNECHPMTLKSQKNVFTDIYPGNSLFLGIRIMLTKLLKQKKKARIENITKLK